MTQLQERIPNKCLISKSVLLHNNNVKLILDDIRSTKVENNEILQSIVKNMPLEPKKGDKFIAYIKDFQYGIMVTNHNGKKTTLLQYFLRLQEGKMIAHNYRKVIISWK